MLVLPIVGRSITPPRGDDAYTGLHLIESRFLEYRIAKRSQCGRFLGASVFLHHRGDLLFVEVTDFLDWLAERSACAVLLSAPSKKSF